MTIKEQALNFALKAHRGQVRKSEPDKPMMVHPIMVGKILEEYGFDDNVIAAGYLHDVVEDTIYKDSDILVEFGDDIASLVMGASEPDKSLSWEERKKHTINSIKELDLRHKAVICADKISNLEDLQILFEKNMNKDFSHFKRGFDKQKWYYESVYRSLVFGEDEELLMFKRLNKLVNYIFNDITMDDYLRDVIFEGELDVYESLISLNFKNLEVFRLNKILTQNKPFVIEFTGTPRTGKTTLINNLKDFFKKQGFKVQVLEEFTTSLKYKNEIAPLLKPLSLSEVNTEIPKYVLQQLNDVLNNDIDILIIDRSLFDRLIWVNRLKDREEMETLEYNSYLETYIPLIKDKIDIIIATYADTLVSLKRDYMAYLSLAKRGFLCEDNIESFNKALMNAEKIALENNFNFYKFDTTENSERHVAINVADVILDSMRKKYLDDFYDYYYKD